MADRDIVGVVRRRHARVDEVRREADRTMREEGMATHLVIISDREPLAWVLRIQRIASPAGRAATGLPAEGDHALLYTTLGCSRNPTRDLPAFVGNQGSPAGRAGSGVAHSQGLGRLAPARPHAELAAGVEPAL
ncbi:hypothetical protein [Streptomyces sp. NPDC046332]|uniref:hypothetical protein n=1 Tax=Streptomyces sp. NPDC046332 TaxID=3155133 RepID=UPI0033F72C3D